MTMTEHRRRGDRRASPAGRAPSPGPMRRVRRPVEMVLVGLGMVAALIAHGGFTLVMNRIDQPTFEAVIMPALVGENSGLSGEEARMLGDTLAAWLGMSLVVLLLLAVAGIAHHRARPARRAPGWWFLAAGAVCLLGSQLILYPVAFLFFAAATLFALRPLPEGSPR